MSPVHLYAPRVVHTPHRPPCSSVHLHGFGAFACCGGLLSTLDVCWDTSLTPPLFGGSSPLLHPSTLCWFPVHCFSQGYQYLMWAFPFLLKGLGVFPHYLGSLGGTSALQLSSCSFLYFFFVVHYVSRFDHSSNYYSSSYSGIFWHVISDSGSFPDRVSSKPWYGSTTTLDAEGLWRCSWLCFCAAAATSIFNASSGFCQLWYGFSTGRFLFQS